MDRLGARQPLDDPPLENPSPKPQTACFWRPFINESHALTVHWKISDLNSFCHDEWVELPSDFAAIR
jgi:hypothetical protein